MPTGVAHLQREKSVRPGEGETRRMEAGTPLLSPCLPLSLSPCLPYEAEAGCSLELGGCAAILRRSSSGRNRATRIDQSATSGLSGIWFVPGVGRASRTDRSEPDRFTSAVSSAAFTAFPELSSTIATIGRTKLCALERTTCATRPSERRTKLPIGNSDSTRNWLLTTSASTWFFSAWRTRHSMAAYGISGGRNGRCAVIAK